MPVLSAAGCSRSLNLLRRSAFDATCCVCDSDDPPLNLSRERMKRRHTQKNCGGDPAGRVHIAQRCGRPRARGAAHQKLRAFSPLTASLRMHSTCAGRFPGHFVGTDKSPRPVPTSPQRQHSCAPFIRTQSITETTGFVFASFLTTTLARRLERLFDSIHISFRPFSISALVFIQRQELNRLPGLSAAGGWRSRSSKSASDPVATTGWLAALRELLPCSGRRSLQRATVLTASVRRIGHEAALPHCSRGGVAPRVGTTLSTLRSTRRPRPERPVLIVKDLPNRRDATASGQSRTPQGTAGRPPRLFAGHAEGV